MISQTISHYRILQKLGAGGMGEVYLAEDTALGRKVAIKFLPEQLMADERATKRLIREAHAAAALDHPNICSIYEVGQAAGHTFIVMQYIEGEMLATRMAREPMELHESLAVALQVADGLSEAHSHGIIHRDIKPQNIMLTARGQVKVLDFGLAKVAQAELSTDSEAATQSLLTEPGMIIGTVQYMSPEQVKGETLDARSDIFSFGVVLYEMMSGHHPFAAETPAATISSTLTREPLPLARYSREAPVELERIVSKALRKDREERYQVVKDLALDLKSLKEELEFEVKLERSLPPDTDRAARAATGAGHAKFDTADNLAIRTDEIGAAPESRAASVTNAFRSHKRGAALAAGMLVVAVAAALFFYFKPTAALTDKDTILIADFVNTTGDAVFDGALKQALAVQLVQSPFLNIFSEERVGETLRYMSRSPEERLTKDIARQVCQRQGIKAMLVGSISPLGSNYIIGLEAIVAHNGDVIAREQVQAESKEQLIATLGKAATKLREKLGESLSSIQKFDAPIGQATTSSLEALKAWSLSTEQNRNGKFNDAVTSLKRAVTLDPNFALAYSGLARNYDLAGHEELAAESAQKAFDLRDRVSEREKLSISETYYDLVTGESDKLMEVLELRRQIYPRAMAARNNLGFAYLFSGRYKEAIEMFNEALRLDPGGFFASGGMGEALTRLNRFDEAREFFNQSLARNPDVPYNHARLYELGFVQGGSTLMKQQLDWVSGRPDEYLAFDWQAQAAAFAGRWREASNLSRRAVDLARGRDRKREASRIAAEAALRGAIFDQCRQARADSSEALALSRSRESLVGAARALALCGEVGQAHSLAGELAERSRKRTLLKDVWLPLIRAAIELQRRNPDKAIELLQPASRYEGGTGGFWPAYLSGQAYLLKRAGRDAAAEFQKILDHRGWDPTSCLYPLAHLGLARAAALTGDPSKSRKAYQDFFALWKDADADLPILIEAKKEYERIK